MNGTLIRMLTVVGGPMFSGKTTWLITYAATLKAGTFVLFKPDIDTRYGKDICMSHDGKTYPAKNMNARNPVFPRLSRKIKTILIDEVNFFSPDLITEAIQKKIKKGKDIVVAGLLYDYRKQIFGAAVELSKKADRFIQLYAKCDMCKRRAVNSYRKVGKKSQFLLGGGESYGACCDDCYHLLQ